MDKSLPEFPSRPELMELFSATVEEVHKYHDLYHRRISFFTSLMTTLLTAIAIGFFQAKTWEHYTAILPACLLLFMVGFVARKALKGCYRLLLECIATRAKIEQLLGMTRRHNLLPKSFKDGYWLSEPIIPMRHLSDRQKFNSSSQAWVDFFKNDSPHEWTKQFLAAVQILALAAAVFAGALAFESFKQKTEALATATSLQTAPLPSP
jgi:hypothetical protein